MTASITRKLATLGAWLALAASAHAGILVVAPHPDDDVITSAGVIRRAAGFEQVKVLYMTNGDENGTADGYLRQGEAVAAQIGYLGMVEDDLIFLGYPDGYLQRIFDSYVSIASQYVTPTGQARPMAIADSAAGTTTRIASVRQLHTIVPT